MGRRIDYLNDPNAPRANSLVPSANAVVTNDRGQILLIRRTDNDNWSLPGGAMDLGETIADAAVREVEEETGIRCKITGLLGIYTNPAHVVQYTSDGEARQEFTIVLTAEVVSGAPRTSDESSQVEWIDPTQIDAYDMHPSMRQRIERFRDDATEPYIG